MGPLRGNAEHLLRIAGLFLAGAAGFVVLRAALIPDGFGLYGHYRAGAIEDNRRDPLVHAGRAVCASCHAPQATLLGGGKHAAVGCEACHGALGAHAREPVKAAAVKPDGRALCLRCHQKLTSRPAPFPQVEPAEHAPDGACLDCHVAHDPHL
jgi:predicted CXXCH cytochrome family protein